ncbi:adenine deaminase [Cetobacterium somerae]|uniref:adenine deaminase n=1 Tax=Cetobacterium sp. NK01 TaxID=2993530 RepID=UPI0021163CBD|nr:adenine deaminase [Cetobacterium sp. NK01]MCQ8213570.1 adenine deaminase [Cetobacterium sp. NK01]
MKLQERKELVEVALGKKLADLVLTNGNLINVFTGEIYKANIYIYKEYIANVVPIEEDNVVTGKNIIDLKNNYIAPGFIDSHVHIESSHLTPDNFAKIVVPKGTTTIIADPHEIANVLGIDGVKYMIEKSKGLPMNQYFLIPSCVPSVLGLENAGAEFTPNDIKKMFNLERVLGLGEVMDFMGVINQSKRMTKIIDVAIRKGVFVQGHAPGLKGKSLAGYICGGPISCHESTEGEEALDKLRKGMFLDARESSISKNITSIIEKIKIIKSLRNLTLCTDDREAGDLLKEGSVNHCAQVAIKAGLDAVEAIRAITLNPAQEYKLDKIGGIAPGYFADIVILDNLIDFNVMKTFFKGKLVAENNQLLDKLVSQTLEIENLNSIHLKELKIEDFMIKAPIQNGEIEIEGLVYLNKNDLLTERKKLKVKVLNGYIDISDSSELNYVAIVNRHKKIDNISLGVVKNFHLKKGGVGTTYSHDSHNLTIIYNNPLEALAISEKIKEIRGGIVVAEKTEILKELHLPIAGMLSRNSAEILSVEIEEMNSVLKKMGIEAESPITRPSTIALIVIPDVKISDLGLIDVKTQEIIKLFDEHGVNSLF